MQKKIIAVACAVIIIATLFASCGKKLYTQEINGIQRPVVTEENGELITDSEGLIKVYVTNAKGELMTAEDGSPNYNYIKPPVAYVNGDKVNIENFELKVPEGFKANNLGMLMKSGANEKCYIRVDYCDTVSKENPFQGYLDQIVTTNNKFMDEINSGKYTEKGYKTVESDLQDITISGETDAHYMAYKILSPEGKVVHYAVSVYFLIGDDIYSANYACVDGEGYDESFDFLDWLQNGLTITAKNK